MMYERMLTNLRCFETVRHLHLRHDVLELHVHGVVVVGDDLAVGFPVLRLGRSEYHGLCLLLSLVLGLLLCLVDRPGIHVVVVGHGGLRGLRLLERIVEVVCFVCLIRDVYLGVEQAKEGNIMSFISHRG